MAKKQKTQKEFVAGLAKDALEHIDGGGHTDADSAINCSSCQDALTAVLRKAINFGKRRAS